MHYSVLVVTDRPPTEKLLASKLRRWECKKWDWFQLGGRYSGRLAPDYDPTEDPANKEVCSLCDGTGKRTDDIGNLARDRDPDYSCNGCNGTGIHLKWPTQWREDAPGNYAQVKDVDLTRVTPTFAILVDGEWHETVEFGNALDYERWEKKFRQLLASLSPTSWLSVVDCHN